MALSKKRHPLKRGLFVFAGSWEWTSSDSSLVPSTNCSSYRTLNPSSSVIPFCTLTFSKTHACPRAVGRPPRPDMCQIRRVLAIDPKSPCSFSHEMYSITAWSSGFRNKTGSAHVLTGLRPSQVRSGRWCLIDCTFAAPLTEARPWL